MGAALGMHPDMLGKGVESVVHAVNWWIVAPGFVIILAVMYWWWADVIAESRTYHTAVVQLGLRYGMILFIASEVLFFAAFFWAFFDASIYPASPEMPMRAEANGGVWPPKGVHVIAPFDLPFMNTLILLLSGTTVTWAHHAILEGNKRDAVRGLLLTVILGICFTSIQLSNTSTRRSASATTSIRRPSSWRPASTASTSWSAPHSCWSACSGR
jgi:cytochrome c oxidase subunit 3